VYWRDVLSAGLPVRRAETVVRRDGDFTESQSARVLARWEDVVISERSRKRRRTEDQRRDEDDESDIEAERDPNEGDEGAQQEEDNSVLRMAYSKFRWNHPPPQKCSDRSSTTCFRLVCSLLNPAQGLPPASSYLSSPPHPFSDRVALALLPADSGSCSPL